MKKRRTIIKALMALLVILLGANFNAEAQLGGLINAAKNKAKQNKEQKGQSAQLSIPQPEANGSIISFKRKNMMGVEQEVAKWNSATLELTMTDGIVYKVDPATGKVTDSKGTPKGSMSSNGSIDAPNFGTIQVKQDGANFFYVWRNEEKLGGIVGVVGEVYYGDRRLGDNGTVSDKTVSPLLMAYVYYGLVFTQDDFSNKSANHANAQKAKDDAVWHPEKKYTTAELEDMVEWTDQESIDAIIKYESSLPCAGFKNSHPEFKNCKIGAVGLMERAWREGSEWDSYYAIRYWVVYELTDGRNIVTFSSAQKKFRYGDVENRWRKYENEFHEVTDWQRK